MATALKHEDVFARLQRFKSLVLLFSIFYLPLVALILQLLADLVPSHPLASQQFPRLFLFSIFVAIGLYFIPQLLNVSITSSPPSILDDEGTSRQYWMQHSYIPQLRMLFKHSHHDPGTRGFAHEWCVKGKCFCTGCHGTAIGICIALIIILLYMSIMLPRSEVLTDQVTIGIMSIEGFSVIIILSWCLFGLFLMKHVISWCKKPPVRLFLNTLLPLSLTTFLIGVDLQHANALMLMAAALLLLPIIPLRVLLTRVEE